jgi:hypothetical protein
LIGSNNCWFLLKNRPRQQDRRSIKWREFLGILIRPQLVKLYLKIIMEEQKLLKASILSPSMKMFLLDLTLQLILLLNLYIKVQLRAKWCPLWLRQMLKSYKWISFQFQQSTLISIYRQIWEQLLKHLIQGIDLLSLEQDVFLRRILS